MNTQRHTWQDYTNAHTHIDTLALTMTAFSGTLLGTVNLAHITINVLIQVLCVLYI